MKRKIIFINAILSGIFLLFNISCGQEKPVDLSKFGDTTRSLLQQLQKVNTFAMGPVGYAGTISESEKAAAGLARQVDANEAFQWLLANGSMEAKLYALWGLRKINGRSSRRFFEPFRNSTQKVKTMSGCEISDELMSQEIKSIENPYYLQIKTQEFWRMEPERKKEMLTLEEQKFLTAIFRLHKGNDFNTLSEIADIPFGELFKKEAERILDGKNAGGSSEFKFDELKIELDKAWKNIEKPAGDRFIAWNPAVSPPFPSAWKDGEPLTWTRYVYAQGMESGLNDAVRVSNVLARVVFNPATGLAKLEILSPKLDAADIQGVKPVAGDVGAVLGSQTSLSESVVKISVKPNTKSAEMEKTRKFYSLWYRYNGVIGKQIEPRHPDFFQWFSAK